MSASSPSLSACSQSVYTRALADCHEPRPTPEFLGRRGVKVALKRSRRICAVLSRSALCSPHVYSV